MKKVVVLDTNIVLDLWVFDEPSVAPLRESLEQNRLQWLATTAMREELVRVLTYPAVVKSLSFHERHAADVLQRFDELAQRVEVAPKTIYTCKDPDDQHFIDLAVQHRAALLSKDKAVLCMKKRLLGLESRAQTATEFIANEMKS